MKTKIFAVALVFAMVFSFAACKKESEAPLTKPGTTGEVPAGHPGSEGGVFVPEVKETVVPDSVKDAWKGVKLSIEDKQASTTNDVVVDLGSNYAIPDTNLKIQVGDFLPDFKMAEGVVTSASNDLNNPAVHVVVMEGDKEIFNNWLYEKFPAIHPFMHERFGITLKEAIAKG
jgi:hypothetical protein